MGVVIAASRYVLPVITLIILIKCMLPLILGHPKEKVYGYIIDLSDGESYPLGMWETSIGRSNSCDIVIGYNTVSRFQAVISRRIDGWYVYDLFSKSGIKVNGEKIGKKKTIKNGDILSFGMVQYRFAVANDPVIKVGKRKSKKLPPENLRSEQPAFRSGSPAAYSNEPLFKEDIGSEPTDYNDIYTKERLNLRFEKYDSRKSRANSSIYSSGASFDVQTPARTFETPAYTFNAPCPALVNPDSGEKFVLSGNHVSIGRNRTNDIVLYSAQVSRHHADIVLYEDGWAVVDANSSAGTYLNGKRITQPQLLFDGDVIGLADERLYYSF